MSAGPSCSGWSARRRTSGRGRMVWGERGRASHRDARPLRGLYRRRRPRAKHPPSPHPLGQSPRPRRPHRRMPDDGDATAWPAPGRAFGQTGARRPSPWPGVPSPRVLAETASRRPPRLPSHPAPRHPKSGWSCPVVPPWSIPRLARRAPTSGEAPRHGRAYPVPGGPVARRTGKSRSPDQCTGPLARPFNRVATANWPSPATPGQAPCGPGLTDHGPAGEKPRWPTHWHGDSHE